MEAGRELDVLVAEKVMGYRKEPIDPRQYQKTYYENLIAAGKGFVYYPPEKEGGYTTPPPFSTDIAAAWKVVERMAENGYITQMYLPPSKVWAWMFQGNGRLGESDSKTAPLAICLAALKAVGV